MQPPCAAPLLSIRGFGQRPQLGREPGAWQLGQRSQAASPIILKAGRSCDVPALRDKGLAPDGGTARRQCPAGSMWAPRMVSPLSGLPSAVVALALMVHGRCLAWWPFHARATLLCCSLRLRGDPASDAASSFSTWCPDAAQGPPWSAVPSPCCQSAQAPRQSTLHPG